MGTLAGTAPPDVEPLLFPELASLRRPSSRGVFPSQAIEELIAAGHVTAERPIAAGQIQPASLDLRLGDVAYRVRASFLPGKASTVMQKVEALRMHEIPLRGPTVLERDCVYVIPVQERVKLPGSVIGKANPKSTIGRLDVFTRLLTDHGEEFDKVEAGYAGPLYVEVVPRTFSILVREGATLNQLRFLRGAPSPSDAHLGELHRRDALLYEDNLPAQPNISQGLKLSVDLQGTNGGSVIGYRAKHHASLIDLERRDYDLDEFWEPLHATGRGLLLDPEDFYILASRERVSIPPDYAAEMVPYDPSVGEFRIHYAGFFDPGFGYGGLETKGAHAVLEVRSHGVPFLLEDGQVIGRLLFEQLVGIPDKLYGVSIGSSYQAQGLMLSKQFKRP